MQHVQEIVPGRKVIFGVIRTVPIPSCGDGSSVGAVRVDLCVGKGHWKPLFGFDESGMVPGAELCLVYAQRVVRVPRGEKDKCEIWLRNLSHQTQKKKIRFFFKKMRKREICKNVSRGKGGITPYIVVKLHCQLSSYTGRWVVRRAGEEIPSLKPKSPMGIEERESDEETIICSIRALAEVRDRRKRRSVVILAMVSSKKEVSQR